MRSGKYNVPGKIVESICGLKPFSLFIHWLNKCLLNVYYVKCWQELAMADLMRGLHYPKYALLMEVLEREFGV